MTDPWFKFYPSDWRGDAGLRQCSYAARGLWIDLITIMHEANSYGFLLVNGKPQDARKIAAMLGGTERQVEKLLEELEAAGVFSRDDDGTIYSRRMLKDKEKAERDRANGQRGGNPDLIRSKGEKVNPEGPQGVNPPLNGQDNGCLKAQIPEARYQKPEREEPPLVAPPQPKPRTARGTRLSTDWKPNAEEHDFAVELGLNAWEVCDRFRDYWIAKAGANGTKLDWSATWRNWCRREKDQGPPKRQEFRNGFLEIAGQIARGEELPEADNPVADFLRLPHVH